MVKYAWLALIHILLCTCSIAHAAEKELSFIADEWCPYVCKSETEPGYLVEIVKAVYEPQGYKVALKVSPWSYKRILNAVRDNRYDGAIGVYKGDAPDFVFPSHLMGQSVVGFFVRKDNPWKFEGIKSLESIKIGVVDGYDYGSDEFLEYVDTHKNTPHVQVMLGEDPIKKNLQKIYLGRLDATAEDVMVVNHLLKQLNYTGNFKQVGILGKPVAVQVGFSPKNKHAEQYAKMLSDGIEELRNSGKLKQILATYNLTDWSGQH